MSKHVTLISWDEVPHLSERAKQEMLEAIPPHMRDARTKGVPAIGAGAIYPVPEADIVIKPFEFPPWYRHVYGLDVGWNRTAAIWAAIDPETDIAYLYSEHYRGQAEPPIHAQAIHARGRWIPGVIDPAAGGRQQDDGEILLQQYRALDLNLTPANNAVEAGIFEVWMRLSSGRMKVFNHLQNWLGEFRIYQRDKNGKVAKQDDHLMDSTRYLCVSGIRLATPMPIEMVRGIPGVAPKPSHQSEYKPYDAAFALGRKPQTDETRRNWMPGANR